MLTDFKDTRIVPLTKTIEPGLQQTLCNNLFDMRYKVELQFRWLIVLVFLLIFYLSNLILIKLPFIYVEFPQKDIEHGIILFLLSFFPRLHLEYQVYNIQTIIVWSSGALAGARLALITTCLYLLLGFLGLPFFASGGGLNYFKEPTLGYLISLPLCAFLSGYFREKNKSFLGAFIPILAVHFFGILYLIVFKQNWLDISWFLSFSLIGYDLIFAILLTPIMPLVSFFFSEMFIQEIPTMEILSAEPKQTSYKSRMQKQ